MRYKVCILCLFTVLLLQSCEQHYVYIKNINTQPTPVPSTPGGSRYTTPGINQPGVYVTQSGGITILPSYYTSKVTRTTPFEFDSVASRLTINLGDWNENTIDIGCIQFPLSGGSLYIQVNSMYEPFGLYGLQGDTVYSWAPRGSSENGMTFNGNYSVTDYDCTKSGVWYYKLIVKKSTKPRTVFINGSIRGTSYKFPTVFAFSAVQDTIVTMP